ncbi:hypothetical protein KM043_001043 [Ampulex compressa]|nr:hypothetical protein KM043_001043 [Ampulex compressa]
MSNEERDVDVNKAFESLLFAEEVAQDSGYQEGYEAGRNRTLEGYHLGYHRASLLGAQLGYYSGILEQYLGVNDTENNKVAAVAKKILDDIEKFPRQNDDTVDIENAMEGIKFQYAKFCAMAKISSVYPEADKLNF